jgi:uncharacterized protein (DUF1697 family)
MFLKKLPVGGAVEALQEAIRGPELVRLREKDAYITYPDGIGGSHLTNAFAERKLGTRGTARNWNTIMKLRALTTSNP